MPPLSREQIDLCLKQITGLYTPLTEKKHEIIRSYLNLCATLPTGEFWDVGCYGGITALMMKGIDPHREIRLFDSFEGIPEGSNRDGNNPKGMFSTSVTEAHKLLGHVHAGWIPETFSGLEDSRIAFAHVDLDLYQGTLDSLQFIIPRLVPNGIVIVDDYGSEGWHGVTSAVNEFLLNNPTKIAVVFVPEQAVILNSPLRKN